MTLNELKALRAEKLKECEGFLAKNELEGGVMSAENAAVYDKMEAEVLDLKRQIERKETLEAENAMIAAKSAPILNSPAHKGGTRKSGAITASDTYGGEFWNYMRSSGSPVTYSLIEGSDSQGGYLVPDEFDRTLVQALEKANIFRKFAKVIRTSGGNHIIPLVNTHGEAKWKGEGQAYEESDDTFGQLELNAYKLTTMVKVSKELLQDSAFNLDSYIST
jgi:HK97 family phage major capsid protein